MFQDFSAMFLFVGLVLVGCFFFARMLLPSWHPLRWRKASPVVMEQFRQIQAHTTAGKEFTQVAATFARMFDLMGEHVPLDPKLEKLLTAVSALLVRGVKSLPADLLHWHNTGERVDPVHTGYLQQVHDIGKLVAEINDPVFKMLWASGAPADLAEMLCHGFFLAYGNPSSVTPSSIERLNLDFPAAKDFAPAKSFDGRRLENRTGLLWKYWSTKLREWK